MENLSGCLVAKLADKSEIYEQTLVEELNRNINPPKPVAFGDVYIRAMYIVSDQVNSQGGRFAEADLERLGTLLVDSPVMVGHQRDSLPVARNFKAVATDIDGRPWVKSYFYWMKDSDGADDLKHNIDGGIYKECSLSFLFGFPECSICGKDIRHCRHMPFQEYEVAGRTEIAHFFYREVEKVLETSLVFRGAIPDTSITDKLSSAERQALEEASPHFHKSDDRQSTAAGRSSFGRAAICYDEPDNFDPPVSIRSLAAFPHQPGLALGISKTGDQIELEATRLLPEPIRRHVTEAMTMLPIESFRGEALLYAVRGKERLDGFSLMRIIESGENLHRLRLRLCDLQAVSERSYADEPYAERLRRLAGHFEDITGDGVEVVRSLLITPSDYRNVLRTGMDAGYHFGLEVVVEDDRGELTRHIVTGREQVPAMVRAVQRPTGGQHRYELCIIGQGSTVTGSAHPKAVSLDTGAAVVLSRRSLSGGDPSGWSVVDVIPGGESLSLLPPRSFSPSAAGALTVKPAGDHLIVRFHDGTGWCTLTIHHFSSRLFQNGRRFIADLRADGSNLFRDGETDSIGVKSVRHLGKALLIRPWRRSQVFGSVRGLWLRPSLIDGEERYLFYADAISGPGGEL
jgi:hypothetical protein